MASDGGAATGWTNYLWDLVTTIKSQCRTITHRAWLLGIWPRGVGDYCRWAASARQDRQNAYVRFIGLVIIITVVEAIVEAAIMAIIKAPGGSVRIVKVLVSMAELTQPAMADVTEAYRPM